MENQPRHRRIGRVIGVTAIALSAAVCLALISAPLLFNGARLGGLVNRFLTALPGQVSTTHIYWRPRLLLDYLLNRPTPLVIEGLRMRDPEGTEVLWVPKMEVKVRPRSAAGMKIVLEDMVLHEGTRWHFASMKHKEGAGFLAAFVPEKADPNKPPDPNFLFEIRNARLLGIDVTFAFPDAWGMQLRDVHGPASMIVQGPFVGWSTNNLEARKGGYLDIVGQRLPWDRAKIRKAETTRAHPDDIFLDVESAETPGAGVNAGLRSRLSGSGYLRAIYNYGVPPGQLGPPSGIDMHVELSNAAPALTAVAAPHNLPSLQIAGGGARITADLHGPFIALDIAGALSGLDVAYAGLPAKALQAGFSLSLAEPMRAAIKDLRFQGASGGTFELDAGLAGPALTARLALRRFGTALYLPAGLRKLLSGRLDGGLAVAANLETSALSLSNVDLRLARAGARLQRAGNERVRIVGRARATPASASTEGLTIELPGAIITAHGRYGLAHQVLGFGLRATAADLPRLLGMWGIPSLARSAGLSVDVGGRASNPIVKGALSVEGLLLGPLPAVDRVQMNLGLADGVATVDSLRADAFGGVVEAAASARLYRRDLFHMVKDPEVVATLNARGLDLARLLPRQQAAGKFDVHVQGAGTARRYAAAASIPANTRITLLGEAWTVAGLEVAADEKGLSIRRARLERSGGGVIALSGRAAWAGPLDLAIDVQNVPLEGLPGVAGAGVSVVGRLGSHLSVQGTIERPLIRGDVRLEQVAVRGVALGNGRLDLQPTADGGIAASGELFGRVSLGGQVDYGPKGPLVAAEAKFRDLQVEQFVPEMGSFGDARARLTGGVQLRYGGANPLTVDLTLTEVDVSADRDLGAASGPQRAGRLQLRNAAPVRVVMTGNQIIVDRTRLVTDGGQLKLWGELKDQVVNAEVEGGLDLELLQAFLGTRVERLGGEINLALRVRGTPRRPLAEGTVDIVRPISVRLPDVGPTITIPSGSVKLDTTALSASNIVVQAEGAQLRVAGQVRLGPRQEVGELNVSAVGELSGALVEAFGQGALSDASGQARVDAHIRGTAAAPLIEARVDLGGLTFALRDLGREIAFQSGRVDLKGMDLTLTNLRARIDGQGEFVIGAPPEGPGRVVLRGAWPSPALLSVRIPMRGQRIPLQVSSAIELEEVGLNVVLAGDERGLGFEGEITVASGRYMRDFNVRELVITPSIDESEFEPFYAGKPWLEKLGLRLRVRTLGDSFLVQNNLVPELHLAFDLLVQGTLAQPRISGDVRPTDGRFHLFGVRENFDLVPNVNQITFVETKSIERGETPEVNLEAEALVTDTSNQEHLVRLRISGPVGRANIDLSTNTGLDRSQALLLLVSGQAGNNEGVFGGSRVSTSASRLGGGGTDVIGQLFADILEPYIDDTLEPITRGKINLRPTLGPDGVELRVDARIGRQFDLRLGILRGLESRRQYRVESSLWLMDYLTLRGLAEQVTYSPQAGLVEEVPWSLKLELSMDFPIRLFLR